MIKHPTTSSGLCSWLAALSLGLLSFSCSDESVLAYEKNTPTSGNLSVYYDEGLGSHVTNQAYTFGVLYPRVNLRLNSASETDAIQALYNDSCETIVITRLLNATETKAFQSRNYSPKYSLVAHTGIALLTNRETPLTALQVQDVKDLLMNAGSNLKDSAGQSIRLQAVFAGANSSSLHYMLDSVIKTKQLSSNCSILESTIETINYVAQHKNAIGFINYAWLSDADDSLYKANIGKIRILGLCDSSSTVCYLPDASNFKLGLYPFRQNVYVMRKQGDFTLAKGFESFVMGPKGQLTFLKQGLLPARQAERNIEVKTSE